ncbi:cathepsin W-like [Alligator sinensis]|uniref:Cathepsin W-like n=1 Tax=Alligator sinensis TaxID=38654 RepID=A0A3Q0HCJ1_ALLSI|nr:cathepsin W-like [Alligator sinensis]
MSKGGRKEEEEFRGVPWTPLDSRPPRPPLQVPPRKSAPPSCDWRKARAVTPPGDQGDRCRACWAFASVANVESLWFIHFKKLYKLSVQEVLDCSSLKDACAGGYPWDAFGTIYTVGVTTAAHYPYQARQGQCRWNQNYVLHIHGFQTLPSNETELAAHIAKRGPITVIMNARLLQNYRSGIITHHLAHNCNPDLLDHVVLIVGYGQEKKIPYWIVKNSYGPDWGEKGYFRIYRGGNVCGIAEMPLTATVGQDGDGAGGMAHRGGCPA